MSLFVCSKCGCIDNTATSCYWALIRPCKNRIYDKSLKGYEGKPLCSECAAIEYSKGDEVVVVPGTWHGKFKKEWPTEEEKKHIGKMNGFANMNLTKEEGPNEDCLKPRLVRLLMLISMVLLTSLENQKKNPLM